MYAGAELFEVEVGECHVTEGLDQLVNVPHILALRMSVRVTFILNHHLISFLTLYFRLPSESIAVKNDAQMRQRLDVVKDQWWAEVKVVSKENLSLAGHLALNTE